MKRITASLRNRIVLAAACSTLVVLIGVGGLVVAGARGDARAALDGRLQRRANQIAQVRSVANVGRTPLLGTAGGALLAANGTAVRIVVNGQLVHALGELPQPAAAHLPAKVGLRTFRAGAADRWRAATVKVRGTPGTFVEVSAPLSQVQDSVRSLRRRVVLVGLLGLLVAVALATLAADYAVRPLARLRATADDVAGTEQLSLRVAEDGPEEVSAVARALNAMLGRLQRSAGEREQALQATRQFAADAGHELRTPLAVLQTGLETLARNPDLPEAERNAIVADTLAEYQRLSALVTALQALTRGDGGAMGDERPVDVGEVIEAAVVAARREDPGAQITTELAPQLPPLTASPTGLRLLLDNLLQNAVRHGRSGVPAVVRISATRILEAAPGADATGAPAGRHAIELAVEDDGPGIPVAERSRVAERFARGAAPLAEGSGLGLAIVAQQAQRLGGQLAISESSSGGARFSMVLRAVPASPDPPATA